MSRDERPGSLKNLGQDVLVGARLPVTVLGTMLWESAEEPNGSGSAAHDEFSYLALETLKFPPHRTTLLGMLAPDVRARLINHTLSGSLNNVRVKHWENVLRIPDYTLAKGWHFRTVSVLAVLGWLLALAGPLSAGLGWTHWASAFWDWDVFTLLVLGIVAAAGSWYEARSLGPPLVMLYLSPFYVVRLVYRFARRARHAGQKYRVPELIASFGIVAVTPFALVCMFVALEFLGRATAVGIIAALAAVAGALLFAGWRKDRAARNPLHGLLSQ